MAFEPPLMKVPLTTADAGFSRGFSLEDPITAKIIIGLPVIWAVIFPEQAGRVLADFNGFIRANFAILSVGPLMAISLIKASHTDGERVASGVVPSAEDVDAIPVEQALYTNRRVWQYVRRSYLIPGCASKTTC